MSASASVAVWRIDLAKVSNWGSIFIVILKEHHSFMMLWLKKLSLE